MKKTLTVFLVLLTSIYGKIRVVTSTSDLAAIAQEIGGDKVSVESIARGDQNPHYIEVLPSYMLKVRRADIYLKVGMELDLWSDQIIGGSRNKDLLVVDCSENIKAQEVPTGKVDASMGDIHRYGNPHYWLDPQNGPLIAESIAKALKKRDPENIQFYENNLRAFNQSVTNSLERWTSKYAQLRDRKLLYYHNTWPYFNYRFGLEVSEFVEPKPGIMPTPNHVDQLVKLIRTEQLKVLAMEPYFSDTAARYLAEKTGIQIVKLAPSVGSQKGTDTYLKMIEYNLDALFQPLGNE
ncbi:MAG: zinc ABC transporter substrate-binding protein [Candidatus Marinimicrobia bacterium]|nr:zinc ABC transporter substrate-binding protein [FCB group bacterium]MBL7025270.1 zinc ABC transporter substrate-binding protein [Candidatus Neomarinimicrobiota bacterium]